MKTAKEMFEKSGYELKKSRTYICYEKDECKIDSDYTIAIEFNLMEKTVHKIENTDCDIEGITTDELKAINKQIEELGWK